MKDDARLQWLWAPWRMTYIKDLRKTKRTEGCFLCRAARGKKDRRNLVLLRGKACFVVLNRYPYNSGHLLVSPLAHKADPGDLTAAERDELFGLFIASQRALDRAIRPDGYNAGMNLGRVAGAGVPGHLHQHLVPRWNGDTNFMPVVGRTKVIPQALDEMYDQLQKALRNRR